MNSPSRMKVILLIAVLASSTSVANAAPKQLLLIGDKPDGHKPGTHEYMAGVRILAKLLEKVPEVETRVVRGAEPWAEGPEMIAKADGVVFFVSQGARWMQRGPRRYDALAKLAERRGGVAALHWGVGAKEGKYVEGQVRLLGGSRGGPGRKHGVFTAKLKLAGEDHPTLCGIEPFEIHDEFYYKLDLAEKPAVTPLLTTRIKGKGPHETVAWAWERPDGGRSFGFVGMHYHRNWQRPEYRRLIAQGVLWSLGLPIAEKGIDVEIDPEALKVLKSDRE